MRRHHRRRARQHSPGRGRAGRVHEGGPRVRHGGGRRPRSDVPGKIARASRRRKGREIPLPAVQPAAGSGNDLRRRGGPVFRGAQARAGLEYRDIRRRPRRPDAVPVPDRARLPRGLRRHEGGMARPAAAQRQARSPAGRGLPRGHRQDRAGRGRHSHDHGTPLRRAHPQGDREAQAGHRAPGPDRQRRQVQDHQEAARRRRTAGRIHRQDHLPDGGEVRQQHAAGNRAGHGEPAAQASARRSGVLRRGRPAIGENGAVAST